MFDYLGTPSPGVCPDPYILEEDTQYFGADRDTSADTDAECRAVCDASSTCLAYGFDTTTNPDQCWIHTDVSQLLYQCFMLCKIISFRLHFPWKLTLWL